MSRFIKSVEKTVALGVEYIMKVQARNFFDRAMGHSEKNQHDRAILDCTEAIRLDSQKSEYFLFRGAEYKKIGDYDRAITDYDEVIRLDPKTAFNFFLRGDAYDTKGEHDRAITEYNKAIELNPGIAKDLFRSGLGRWREGQTDRAIENFGVAIKLKPQYTEALYNRGAAYTSKGDFNRAITDYSEAIQVDLACPESRQFNIAHRAAWVSIHQQKFHYPKEAYDQTTTSEPRNANDFFRRGFLYEMKFDRDHAMSDYDKAIKLDPNDANMHFRRGLLYAWRGEYDRAISDFDEAISIDPKNADYFYERGWAWAGARLGRGGAFEDGDLLRRSLENWKEAEELPSHRADYLFARADAYAITGQYDLAIADYDEAIRLHPKLTWAIGNRAEVITRRRNKLSSGAKAHT